MPIFEYVCNACQKEFEEIVLGDEQPVCPGCGSPGHDKAHVPGRFPDRRPHRRGFAQRQRHHHQRQERLRLMHRWQLLQLRLT